MSVISKVPAHLKSLRQPLNAIESGRMWKTQGGGFQIGLRLDNTSAAAITSFRVTIMTAAGQAPTNMSSQNYVPLYMDFPASGKEFYRDILKQFADRSSPFLLHLGRPFITDPRRAAAGLSVAAGLNVISSQAKSLYEQLWEAFADVPRMKPGDYGQKKRNLKMNIISSGAPKDQQDTLFLARAELAQTNLSATAVGLCLRHNIYAPSKVRKQQKYKALHTDWEEFPFKGDENVHRISQDS